MSGAGAQPVGQAGQLAVARRGGWVVALCTGSGAWRRGRRRAPGLAGHRHCKFWWHRIPFEEQAARWFCGRAALCLTASAAREFATLAVLVIVPRRAATCWRPDTVVWVNGQVVPGGLAGRSCPRGVLQAGRPLRSVDTLGRTAPSLQDGSGRRSSLSVSSVCPARRPMSCHIILALSDRSTWSVTLVGSLAPRRVVDEVGQIGRSIWSARPYPPGFVFAMGSVCSVSQACRSVCFTRFFRGAGQSARSGRSAPARKVPGPSRPGRSVWRSGRPRPSTGCLQGRSSRDAPDPMSPICSVRVARRRDGALP